MTAARPSQHNDSPRRQVARRVDSDAPTSAQSLHRSPSDCAEALRRLSLATERLRLITAQHLGLSLVDSLAVSHLFANGPQGQNELAETLVMTTGSITVLVDRLTARGLAERTAHPSDRRRSIVQLTPAGRATMAQTSGWITEAFDYLEPSEYPTVTYILDAVARGVQDSGSVVAARTDANTNPSRLR